jgi:hypothetical protein
MTADSARHDPSWHAHAPTPGGPTKHKILPCTLPLSLPTAMNSRMRSARSRAQRDEARRRRVMRMNPASTCRGSASGATRPHEAPRTLDVRHAVVVLVEDLARERQVKVVLRVLACGPTNRMNNGAHAKGWKRGRRMLRMPLGRRGRHHRLTPRQACEPVEVGPRHVELGGVALQHLSCRRVGKKAACVDASRPAVDRAL